jgi:uncharacterized membrane protein YcaP (DUF421 family)
MTLPELGSGLPEIALRTAIIYVVVIVLLRVSGKRGVGQMSIVDLVLVLIIANGVQNAMVGQNTSIYGGIVAAATLVVLDSIIRKVADRSPKFERLLEGEPVLLARDGEVFRAAMRKQGISNDELMAGVRSQGLEDVRDARLVFLETNGHITVVPATAKIRPAASPPGHGA